MAEVIRLRDVESAFMEISRDGIHGEFENLPYVLNSGIYHVQGFTKAFDGQTGKEYNVFSHSDDGIAYNGLIIVQKEGDAESTKKFYLPNNEDHPGGMQAIGPYVFIICEKKPHSTLYVFDVRAIDNENIVAFCYKQYFEKHPGSCVGITTTKINGKEKYLLVVNGNEKANHTCYFYTADITDEKDEKGQLKLNFVYIGNDSLKRFYEKEDYDYEGIALLTDENEAVYSLSFTCKAENGYNVDHMILTKVTLSDSKPTFTKIGDGNRSMRAIHKRKHGEGGVHFRWGTSAYITQNRKLVIMSTARNIRITKHLEYNYWL